ncbi:MAG: hypothetical protein AAF846_08905 [Chloroflexota bacterium]
MANSIQHAENTKTRIHEQVQPYMADLFYRLANNYVILFGAILLTNMILLPLLFQLLPDSFPSSTPQVLGFASVLLLLVFGWRFLENRNHATALFALYIRYSRQKRDLEENITLAQDDMLPDENTLYVSVDLLEDSATSLLQAIEEEGLKIHRSNQ